MTQVFADDETDNELHQPARAGEMTDSTDRTADTPSRSSPALMPGKGVRMVRCVGCCRDTLPRPDDGAPLCAHCSEVLANADASLPSPLTGPLSAWAPRWLRRRDAQVS